MPTTLNLDGTLDSLLAFLRMTEVVYHPARLLLQHGRQYCSQPLDDDERRLVAEHATSLRRPLDKFEAKQCFANSQRLVTAGIDHRIVYVEGFVYPSRSIPIPHGWIAVDGKVVDVTLRESGGTGNPILGTFVDRIYWGISFTTRCVWTRQLATGMAQSLLDDAESVAFDDDGHVSEIVIDDRARLASRSAFATTEMGKLC